MKRREFLERETPIEDDHLRFLEAGVPAVDIIDLDYPAWHTAGDTLDKVSAASLQAVGDVLLAALPEIEKRLIKPSSSHRIFEQLRDAARELASSESRAGWR